MTKRKEERDNYKLGGMRESEKGTRERGRGRKRKEERGKRKEERGKRKSDNKYEMKEWKKFLM